MGLPETILAIDITIVIASAIAIAIAIAVTITIAVGVPGELGQLGGHVASAPGYKCYAGKLGSAPLPGCVCPCHGGGGSKPCFKSTYQVSGPRR